MNRMVEVPERPLRIVSLVPSQTEFLFSLDLEEELVGITKFCIHPNDWFQSKKRVGGTKNVNFEKLRELQPDLIIGNKEENERSDIEKLEQEFPVWMSDISNLQEAFEMMLCIGKLVHREQKALEIVNRIRSDFSELQKGVRQKVAYFIWRNPWMMAGKETFIDDMLQRCGWENVSTEIRYPELKEDLNVQADLVLLSSEPYPFKENHIDEIQARFPRAKVVLVDGEMFSWYGSRLLHAPAYFKKLINSI